MGDETTTTWLKKNNEMHPLKRSLKTSMRLQVNNAEMDGSIFSNLDKPKDEQIFIPRMMQRASMRIMKLRTSELLPEIAPPKTKVSQNKVTNGGKSGNNGGTKPKTKTATAAPTLPKKSFLPVRRNQPVSSEKKAVPKVFIRPSFFPTGSIRKTTARRELIQKMVKLHEESEKTSVHKNNELKLSPHLTGDNSVLRSILKKHRASLRRASQMSGESKPKAAKKVIFEDFEKQNNEKNLSLNDESNNDFSVLEEPTVFLNFPSSSKFESTPDNSKGKHQISDSSSESLKNILKMFNSYETKLKQLKSTENFLSSSLETVVQSSQKLKQEFDSYKKISEETHDELFRLNEEVNENLSRILSSLEGRKSPRILFDSDKKSKIRLSDKSKKIRKNSAKRLSPAIKRGYWMSSNENYTLVEKENVFNNL